MSWSSSSRALDELEARLEGAAAAVRAPSPSKHGAARTKSPATSRSNNASRNLMKGYRNLTLSGVNTEQMRTLLNALDDPDAMLETLNLSFNDQLERDNMAQLSESLIANNSVQTLNLSSCENVADADAANLVDKQASALGGRGTRPLHSLTLSHTKAIGNLTAAALARALTDYNCPLQLRTVNLSGCRALSDEGIVAISKALPLSSLTSLSLAACPHVSDDGIIALAGALKSDEIPALQQLDLSWDDALTDASLSALSDALGSAGSNNVLTTLKMSCCIELTDVGFIALATALKVNHGMRSLDFASCVKLGEAGLNALASSMANNRTLTQLDLKGCPVINRRSDEAYVDIVALSKGWSPMRERLRSQESPTRPRARSLDSGSPAPGQRWTQNTIEMQPSLPAEDGKASARQRPATATPRSRSASRKTLCGADAFARLDHLLYRNTKHFLAASHGLAGGGSGDDRQYGVTSLGESAPLGVLYGMPKPPNRRDRGGVRMAPDQMKRTIRTTIVQGASLYSQGKVEQSLRVFVSAAESLINGTDPTLTEAMAAALKLVKDADEGHMVVRMNLQQRVWTLRQAFDAMQVSIEEKEEIQEAKKAYPYDQRKAQLDNFGPLLVQLPTATQTFALDPDDEAIVGTLGIGESFTPQRSPSGLRKALLPPPDPSSSSSLGIASTSLVTTNVDRSEGRLTLAQIAAEQGLILV